MVAKIYLVRHCQTMGNLNRIFQGMSDTDPSPKGLTQLELLGLRFRNESIDKVYSSDLGRAVKTAEAINKYHRVPHIKLEGLREISVGNQDGMDWDKFPELYPEQALNWNNQPWLFESDGGETMVQVYKRMGESFEEIAKENIGKTVVVVSHGCALRTLLCYCFNKPLTEINDVEFGANTAVSLVEITDGERKIVFSNDASHLPEDPNRNPRSAYFKLK